jgi:hypothetical protein
MNRGDTVSTGQLARSAARGLEPRGGRSRFLWPTALSLLTTLLGASAIAGARPPEDLRRTLDRLAGTTPVEGRLTVEVVERSEDQDGTGEQRGAATVRVSANHREVNISIPLELLLTIGDERQRAVGAAGRSPSPADAAMEGLTGTTVYGLLDGAAALRRYLDNATLVSRRRLGATGEQELQFRKPPDVPERERRRVREADFTLEMTLGPDGIPKQALERERIKTRILLANFELTSTVESWFVVAGDRLVVRRREVEGRAVGMGQHTHFRKVYSVVLVQAPGERAAPDG